MITKLVTVEVNLRDSAVSLQQEIEIALTRWDYCSGWVVTDADAQQQIAFVTALVMVEAE
ncbi:hypothetical protein IFO70_32670 [Phormidium tenue FACHB-886]|nr:hypothetical protein [Phormidium tenue FACHB-886]